MKLFIRGTRALLYPGLLLMIMGLLVFIFPTFFAYVFAGIAVFIGMWMAFLGLMSKPIAGRSRTQDQQEYSPYEEIRD